MRRARASKRATVTTVVVTNDFPPRVGGIEGFVADACHALGDDVVVLTRTEDDAPATRRFDSRLPFEVVRIGGPLLPTPRVARSAARLVETRGATRVLYGAAAPLGLLAPTLRRAGVHRQLGLTHGHEVWWAGLHGSRTLLRRIVDGLDHVGVISDHSQTRIAAVLSPEGRRKLVRIPPPVDLARFVPGDGDPGPVVVAAGRLIAQKGVDRLLDVWPVVARLVPGASLLIVGDGPAAPSLSARAARLRGVTMVGPVPYARMPAVFRAARVFALPVRTRLGGLNAEGLGRVFLEAAAAGLPVVTGRSGGAPETVLDGVSGSVVDADDRAGLAGALVRWLADPVAARAAGLAGRDHVAARYASPAVAAAIRRCLDVQPSGPGPSDR